MTVAVTNTNVEFAQQAAIVCEQHKRLLRKFAAVERDLLDVVALLWIPGRGETFDNPVRCVNEASRPVCLTLEVTDGALRFSGAISRFRPKIESLVFKPVFSYDAAAPFSYQNHGRAVYAKNLALTRRVNDLLAALLAAGRERKRESGAGGYAALIWPEVVCDARGRLFEDYTPVLTDTGAGKRHSVPQISTVDAVQNLPVGYSGSVLPPVGWAPSPFAD
jgi:hypothetical protein